MLADASHVPQVTAEGPILFESGYSQISAGIIVLTDRYASSASESLTIWCAVSGPPVGQQMTSPARIFRVSAP